MTTAGPTVHPEAGMCRHGSAETILFDPSGHLTARQARRHRRPVAGAERHRTASSSVAAALLLAGFVVACDGVDRSESGLREAFVAPAEGLVLERVQADLFNAPGGQPTAWADYDRDGDLDLFVGFRGAPNRLYRNDEGTFGDVAPGLGLDDQAETRAAAWGDFDSDGDLDLYVGFRADEANRLYRNEGPGAAFQDVAPELGLDLVGNTRQPSWIDYDNDGDLDLFIAFREQPNRLFRNDGSRFTDVSVAVGIADPRRTVGVAWFDMDRDGDLDAFVANQNGDQDGFYRNDGGRFTDVAPELGMDWPGRTEDRGSVGPAVADYDNDGDLDLFVAMYGPNVLWENQGDGTFREVARGTVLAGDDHSTTAAWADFDHDGWIDLYLTSYLSDVAEDPDHVFRNVAGQFTDVTPDVVLDRGASHGIAWADFDQDGDLDLATANNNAAGAHHLYRNLLPDRLAHRSIQVRVLDGDGHPTLPGAEVRIFDTRDGRLLGTRLVDTGGGYCSQGAGPVHFGLAPGVGRVDVETTALTREGRRSVRITSVDPSDLPGGGVLEVRVER